jgi:zinc transporter 2
VAGFVISFIAVACSKKPITAKYSYGFHRADVLGALATVLIIWALLVWLLYEATNRLLNPNLIQVDAAVMLYTAIIGFGCVLLNLFVLFCCCNDKPNEDDEDTTLVVDDLIAQLKKGRGGMLSMKSPRSTPRGSMKGKRAVVPNIGSINDVGIESDTEEQRFVGYVKEENSDDEDKKEGENVNIRAAVVHMAGDMVQSIGVIAAALVIYIGDKNGHPEYKIADPICTFLFSVLVLMTTVPIFGDMMRLLLEGTPIDSVDTIKLFEAICDVSNLGW